jgi:hypothetical protein
VAPEQPEDAPARPTGDDDQGDAVDGEPLGDDSHGSLQPSRLPALLERWRDHDGVDRVAAPGGRLRQRRERGGTAAEHEAAGDGTGGVQQLEQGRGGGAGRDRLHAHAVVRQPPRGTRSYTRPIDGLHGSHEQAAVGAAPSRLADRSLATASALAGCALLVAATVVPINGGGTSGYPYALIDRSVQRELVLFAAQPLATVVGVVVALAVLGRWRRVAAGALLAFGLEMCVLFAAHLGAAAFGNPLYNSFRAGSLLGVMGGLLVIVSGIIAAAADPTRRPVPARADGSHR